MRRLLLLVALCACLPSSVMAADEDGHYVKTTYAPLIPLTAIFNLNGRTDNSGNLYIVNDATGTGQTPLTPIGVLQGRTDSFGSLYVNCTGCASSTVAAPFTITQADNTQALIFSTATYTSNMATKPTISLIATENTAAGTHDYLNMTITRTAGEYNYLHFLGGAAGTTETFSVNRSGNITTIGDVTALDFIGNASGSSVGAFQTAVSFPANLKAFNTTGTRNTSNTGSNAASAWDLAHTLNTSGVVPGIIKLAITNTAEGAGTRALEIDSGATLTFGVTTGHTATGTQVRTAQTTVPTCSTNCGTGSPAVVGSDTAGIVTMGATGSPASGWVVTFNGTWAAAPSCTVQMAKAGMAVGKMALTVVTTTTTFTVVTNGTAPANSDVYAYTCIGVQ